MSMQKVGVGEKILEVAKNAEEFSKMWVSIEKTNNLVKCSGCSHLLSKKGTNGELTIKHKKLAAVVKGGSIELVCPSCGVINRIS